MVSLRISASFLVLYAARGLKESRWFREEIGSRSSQHASVPKFGNWEDDDVPYTQYFDNARKGKISGRVINPNDPEENQESLNKYNPVSVPKPKDVDIMRPPPGSPLRHDVMARKLVDPHRRANKGSAGSDRSLEQSPLHPNFQIRYESRVGVNSPLRERRGSLEGHGLAPNTPGRSRANHRGDGMPDKGPAVPKFGEWDESNPASADEYTQIFKEVSKEKQDGSARVPSMSKESSHHGNSHKPTRDYESSRCGCFGWLKN